jgi:hypothetical protein
VNRFWLRAAVSAVIAGIWVASLALPVVDTQTSDGVDTPYGIDILKIGWMGIVVYQFGWFANVLLVPGLALATWWRGRAPKVHRVIATILLALAVNAAFWTNIPAGNGENEIISYRSGYWFWMVSVTAGAVWLVTSTLTRSAHRQDAGQPIE